MPFSRQEFSQLAFAVVFPSQYLFLSWPLYAIWNLHRHFQTFPSFLFPVAPSRGKKNLLLSISSLLCNFLIFPFTEFTCNFPIICFPRGCFGVCCVFGVILELMTPTRAFHGSKAIIKVQNFKHFLDTNVAFPFFFPPSTTVFKVMSEWQTLNVTGNWKRRRRIWDWSCSGPLPTTEIKPIKTNLKKANPKIFLFSAGFLPFPPFIWVLAISWMPGVCLQSKMFGLWHD